MSKTQPFPDYPKQYRNLLAHIRASRKPIRNALCYDIVNRVGRMQVVKPEVLVDGNAAAWDEGIPLRGATVINECQSLNP